MADARSPMTRAKVLGQDGARAGAQGRWLSLQTRGEQDHGGPGEPGGQGVGS